MQLLKRVLLILGISSVFMALVWLFVCENQINKANFYRVQNGMSKQEVYKILGGPRRWSVMGEFERPGEVPWVPPPATWELWDGVLEDIRFEICFDSDDGDAKVLGKVLHVPIGR